jgi:hypothetical protein
MSIAADSVRWNDPEKASIENVDRCQRKNPFVHSPKNFHIEVTPDPIRGDTWKDKDQVRNTTMKAKKKAAAKKAPAKKPAKKKAKK